MLPIKPHLWFDNQAKEAAEFYTTLMPDSAINYISQLHNTPSGDCDIVEFTVAGRSFMAISAGPLFKFNPSISFMINFEPSHNPDAALRIDNVWSKLVDGGTVMMALDRYPFSERYGWVADKYGVSWQITSTLKAEVLKNGTPEQIDRVTQAFMPMKKFDVTALQKAYQGE